MDARAVPASPLPVPGWAGHVRRAFAADRLAAVGLLTLLLSLGSLATPTLFDFFTPAEAALAWLEHLGEVAAVAAVLLAAHTVVDFALPRTWAPRLAVIVATLLALAATLSVLLHAYYAGGFDHLPDPSRMLAASLRWGLPAAFLALIADLHRRALQAEGAAHAADALRAQFEQGASEQQLALLQAQLEPHFLFNMLGNVRRLYRTDPGAAADAVGHLMTYVQNALPHLRSRQSSLAEEAATARAYLELFRLRMGTRLDYTIDIGSALLDRDFPPMLLVTLVENAVKHGVEPVGGGHIEIRARARGGSLEVSVLDDGAGFGATASSGTGVGLVNIRRQLAARYRDRARLSLAARTPRGACATIVLPLGDARRDAGAAIAMQQVA